MAGLIHRVFGGYSELLKVPHSLRWSLGALLASFPSPMVGMTMTITVTFFYHNNYALAGTLSAVQAIALAILGPIFGKLIDLYGQHRVAIPIVCVWVAAATTMTICVTNQVNPIFLYFIAPFLAFVPPYGGMSRMRWTKALKGEPRKIERALSLASIFDECLWLIGNPLASILAVISGVLAFSFTGVCVIIGAIMFLSLFVVEPEALSSRAKSAGLTVKEYRQQLALNAQEKSHSLEETETPIKQKTTLFGPAMISVCAAWFGLGAFQAAANISVISFASASGQKSLTGFIFAAFSLASLVGATIYGAKNWQIPLWKRFSFCLAVLVVGMSTFMFAPNIGVIALIYLFIGLCQSPTWINGNQLMLHLVPPARFTEGMGWVNSMNAIGSSIGSAVAGIFINQYGSHSGFVTVTCFAFAALAIAFIGFKQIRTNSLRPMLTQVNV
jgi:MFS family permease